MEIQTNIKIKPQVEFDLAILGLEATRSFTTHAQ